MDIRRAGYADLGAIFQIYAHAREQMKLNGNPDQWGDDWPVPEVIEKDIEHGDLYLIEEKGAVCGVFAFIIGEDPTYREIEGRWLDDQPYGTIHRVASSGHTRGILDVCVDHCLEHIKNIRIDTHADNKIMQHLLEKRGFKKCGIIYLEDGSPRIAYQGAV